MSQGARGSAVGQARKIVAAVLAVAAAEAAEPLHLAFRLIRYEPIIGSCPKFISLSQNLVNGVCCSNTNLNEPFDLRSNNFFYKYNKIY